MGPDCSTDCATKIFLQFLSFSEMLSLAVFSVIMNGLSAVPTSCSTTTSIDNIGLEQTLVYI